MMTHFSVEIQCNQADPSKMKRQGEVNAVLQQVEQQKEQQHLQTEYMVAQTETIHAYRNNSQQYSLNNKPVVHQVSVGP